ncbi:ORF21 [Agrotis segetum granulovirus]|uniref:ORF21 n=1 Tax=Agrotis segetum granulosis virus TaxID=10464 RepID=Q9WHF0_GVAS|nr:pep-2 [Agrotis segetum granulovirus]AAD34379.1 unknown [Agrotis segetum granulovirus]AAS82717.1 ORF21 [Agrotis segetum granulovirus]AHN92061.1 hypothetical protein AsGV022 [Agrotis segetum granulovirus]AKN63296.1 pep-2 [Agrotis segetum granulovirus]
MRRYQKEVERQAKREAKKLAQKAKLDKKLKVKLQKVVNTTETITVTSTDVLELHSVVTQSTLNSMDPMVAAFPNNTEPLNINQLRLVVLKCYNILLDSILINVNDELASQAQEMVSGLKSALHKYLNNERDLTQAAFNVLQSCLTRSFDEFYDIKAILPITITTSNTLNSICNNLSNTDNLDVIEPLVTATYSLCQNCKVFQTAQNLRFKSYRYLGLTTEQCIEADSLVNDEPAFLNYIESNRKWRYNNAGYMFNDSTLRILNADDL